MTSTDLLDWANRCLQYVNPEFAHHLAIAALRAGIYKNDHKRDDDKIGQRIWGLDFANPVGVAAGFDKNGHVPAALINIGFGFTEVGTVTPKAQAGNAKPRVFRLPQDRAVINRYGFNNDGHEAVLRRLEKTVCRGIVGVNVGANKDSQNRIEDFVEGLRVFAQVADYYAVNISSPNTPGLRDLQDPEQLNALLSWLYAARKGISAADDGWRPILIKLAPDLEDGQLRDIVSCLMENDVDGVILTNTTTARENLLDHRMAQEGGGLSGRPLFDRSTEVLAKVYLQTGGKIPLVGVGGIDSAGAALTKIEAGASLVQLYTGLVFEGAGLLSRIKIGLARAVDYHGLSSISELVGRRAEALAA